MFKALTENCKSLLVFPGEKKIRCCPSVKLADALNLTLSSATNFSTIYLLFSGDKYMWFSSVNPENSSLY